MTPDEVTVPLTSGGVDATDLDESRNVDRDSDEPHRQVEAWRAQHLAPDGPVLSD